MAVAEKNEREIEGAEAPVGHDLDEAPVTHELRLDNRWQLADARTGHESRCQAGKVVHREVRLERNSLLVLSVDVEQGPTAFRFPI